MLSIFFIPTLLANRPLAFLASPEISLEVECLQIPALETKSLLRDRRSMYMHTVMVSL